MNLEGTESREIMPDQERQTLYGMTCMRLAGGVPHTSTMTVSRVGTEGMERCWSRGPAPRGTTRKGGASSAQGADCGALHARTPQLCRGHARLLVAHIQSHTVTVGHFAVMIMS